MTGLHLTREGGGGLSEAVCIAQALNNHWSCVYVSHNPSHAYVPHSPCNAYVPHTPPLLARRGPVGIWC